MGQKKKRETYEPGSTVFREGEPGSCAYLIERGVVEISALKNGEPYRLALLGEGDLFGEMALIDDELRTATATATEPAELVAISRDYFRERCDKADPILNVFLHVILERFRATHQVRLQGDHSFPRMPSEAPSWVDESIVADRDQAVRELKLQHELEQALDQDELLLHYQPIVDLKRGHVVGFEALMRWQHSTRGLVPPGQFIGFAERTNVIVPMGLWALSQAPLVLKRFQHTCDGVSPDGPPLYMSVNVSSGQLSTLKNVDAILEALTGSGIDMRRVKLEITETVLMADPKVAAASLQKLKEVGLTVAIDDFGTGYSSLGYLHRFPLDVVKIDRSFVDSMLRNPASMKIVKSIAHLAHDLELSIIAEGVETEAQFQYLLELGCECAQGYLFARPQSPEEIDAMLRAGTNLVERRGQ
ncbi:MAG: EAL domain-containing protein [Deltaproteobacteria bacterium]|nr:EAL domain-containing protein [Deltaproteobacteria bacterium]